MKTYQANLLRVKNMTTLNKSTIAQIAADIAEIVDTRYDVAHGLRIVNNNHDNFDIIEGDFVEHSHDWDFENDMSSDDLLDGCSTIGLNDSDDAEWIATKIEKMVALYGNGAGKCKLVLVSGDDMGYGDDDNELLVDGFATKVYKVDMD